LCRTRTGGENRKERKKEESRRNRRKERRITLKGTGINTVAQRM
jgi:hypothetical protein